MPVAVARNRHHDSAVAARRASAYPPPKPAHDSRRVARARVETTAEPNWQSTDWQSVEPLLDHFNGVDEQARVTRAARRRARRTHRPLQLSWPVGIVAALLLGHLVALLWLHGCALAARNRDARLTRQVQQASNEVNQIQKQIASLSSPAQLDQWARKRGWHKAALTDTDDVTKPAAARWNALLPNSESQPQSDDNLTNDGDFRSDSQTTARVEIEVQGESEIR
ncbi:MAG TPA: hypothetical protein VNA16_09440 [Abditibacteriaceae bacterium]|nr:hypothetical protein [Abditibacteriaceae bacterium]